MDGEGLQKLMEHKLEAAKRLMQAKEWAFAAYLMGYSAECALKAAACKILGITDYPPRNKNGKILAGFMSHEFEQLVVISGMRPDFHLGGDPKSIDNWGAFTSVLADNWTQMRYLTKEEENRIFTEESVNRLYGNLYDNDRSIIKTIKEKHKW